MPQHGPPGDVHGLLSGGGFPDTITVGGDATGGEAAPTAPDDKIRQIIDIAAQMLSEDGLDDAEKVFLAQMAQLAQKLLGARQKERDGLLGGKLTPSAVRTIGG